jgi:branched-chain amino acid transport system permease protein
MATAFWGELKKSLLAALAFAALAFPLVALRVNTVDNVIEWRWALLGRVAWGVFFLSFLWREMIAWKEAGAPGPDPLETHAHRLGRRFSFFTVLLLAFAPALFDFVLENGLSEALEHLAIGAAALTAASLAWDFFLLPRHAEDGFAPLPSRGSLLAADNRFRFAVLAASTAFAVAFPLLFSPYQVNILIDALIFMVLGLGLNIVVGLAGLLDLGYVAFYAVGAYSYALLNLRYGLDFWIALPVAGALGAFFGILLGIPVLRLRGDYLAIVTLGFGEIIRLLLENWTSLTKGPSGIPNIPSPTLMGQTLGRADAMTFIYYLMVGLALFTIFVIRRLRDSRLGRSWLALREDEIACQAMGIDRMRTKLAAFAMGATWAGLVGAIFAAKTQYINPMSFTFWESVIVLCIVVLGGQGSILGVVVAALAMRLAPEYLRDLKTYRMLFFGAALVLVMVFRPQGLFPSARRIYRFRPSAKGGETQ